MSERLITKGDFENWKLDPITKAFFEAADDRIEDAKDILAIQAGFDSGQDNYFRGFIAAYNEIRDFRVEDE